MNNIQEQVIIMSLEPLFERAESEGLWFFHESEENGEIWASPGFLHEQQSDGRLVLSPEHWELRSPIDYMASIHLKASQLIDEYNQMAERLLIPKVHLTEEQNMTPESKMADTTSIN